MVILTVTVLIVIMSTTSSAPATVRASLDRSERGLSLIDVLNLLGTPKPTELEPENEPESISSGSGDEHQATAAFNVTTVEVKLEPHRLLSNTIKYNFYRLTTFMNELQPGSHPFDMYRNILGGVFYVPLDGSYHFKIVVRIFVHSISSRNDEAGSALCLNDLCNGQLEKTAMFSSSYLVMGGDQSIETTGTLKLKRGDQIKLYVYKSPFAKLTLKASTSIYCQKMD